MESMIVFSHLRWDFVFQRPQHLMTRFSRDRKVFFIEEPVGSDGPPEMDVTEPTPNLFVCKPRLPDPAGGFNQKNLPALQRLVDQLVADRGLRGSVAWFYTPMALPLLQGLEPAVVVY